MTARPVVFITHRLQGTKDGNKENRYQTTGRQESGQL